jgi:ribosomal protein S18 acetylase RimI-like enzyme
MITVKILELEEINNIVALHEKAFNSFFLTSLGTKFLNKFYTSVIKNNDSIAIGAFDETNQLVGFAIGAKVKNGFYKNILKKNFVSLSIAASLNLIKKPKNIQRLLKSFTSKETSNNDFQNYGTLLSICVDPNKTGQKIGQKMLVAFETEIVKYNIGITLTTDRMNNDYVNNFYLSNNYILSDHFNQGNREMNYYIKKIK